MSSSGDWDLILFFPVGPFVTAPLLRKEMTLLPWHMEQSFFSQMYFNSKIYVPLNINLLPRDRHANGICFLLKDI